MPEFDDQLLQHVHEDQHSGPRKLVLSIAACPQHTYEEIERLARELGQPKAAPAAVPTVDTTLRPAPAKQLAPDAHSTPGWTVQSGYDGRIHGCRAAKDQDQAYG